MNYLPEKLKKQLDSRSENNALRSLYVIEEMVDFSSNDYLGFGTSDLIFNGTIDILKENDLQKNGSGGSRLLSGNFKLYEETEKQIAQIHKSEAAVIFNSGYDANIGFFGSLPQREDVVIFDELIHASIRDGIRLGKSNSFKFKHNDLQNLEVLLSRTQCAGEIYVVTESVFSMDGDSPDLKALSDLCNQNRCRLIVDEAHAVGVIGKGLGLVQELGLEDQVFARIITFSKALGCHGAAVLGERNLIVYLLNFARSLIYTTALSPHSIATVNAAYKQLNTTTNIKALRTNITLFRSLIMLYKLDCYFLKSESAIQCCVIPDNRKVKNIALKCTHKGFDVKAILSPTIAVGKERLRICLHSFNTEKEIIEFVDLLATLMK
jgi:8-amino-7-oxononanoate synthase